ncbi:MAG: ATP-grasp domain-containing protein [Alphaproteobacteria bacterium]|nr:ATP-grasp domain-containing protein [Alphaproteobacteria bacterium]
MFKKILIANRGEIACRVIRTARRLGIKTVAVYSDADSRALHVALADEAYEIGPAPARESYLDAQAILTAARRSRAEAIHPGYGFLSENAAFAAGCVKAGLAFIGPQAAAIRAMGNKAAAKALAERAGVPVVPGYRGDRQHVAIFAAEAARIGYPLLVKATAGGGGRGTRVVERPNELGAALESARREATAAFGDSRLILEKYLRAPRHIEVQVFGDRRGNLVHLYARDCSSQRRYQKVLEEAPPAALAPALLSNLHEAALKVAHAVKYQNAGTVEFIVERGRFYFIEMNTRLQVEHAVTEMITGIDLVEWQLRVAAGEALPLKQAQIRARGHAIEVRLYAEDPARGFMPSTGRLARLRFPPADTHLRIETGLRQGDAVTEFYDPMAAKVVAWAKDRHGARRRLRAALVETRILGVDSNRDFLLRLIEQPAFRRGSVDTAFIGRHLEALALPAPAPEPALAAAALSRIVAAPPKPAADRFSPWRLRDGWRPSGESVLDFAFDDRGTKRRVRMRFARAGLQLEFGRRCLPALAWALGAGDLAVELGGRHVETSVAWGDRAVQVALADGTWRLGVVETAIRHADTASAASQVVAPMPGKIAAVHVAKGASVTRGQVLLVLEAMKMEHAIAAPSDGVVAEIRYAAGDPVAEGAELMVLAGAKEAT